MTASIPTQEDVDRIARELAPDVVRIRFRTGYDWIDGPAIYFRVILSDDASRRERLGKVGRMVRDRLSDSFRLWESERIPYFRFRSQSEQASIREASWE